MKKYPSWICYTCGNKYGKHKGVSTSHINTCDVCGEKSYVTQPRDFEGLKLPDEFEKRKAPKESDNEFNYLMDMLK